MKQEIQITVPTDWSAVTLRKYLQLHKDIETYKDNDEAVTAALFYHLCGVDAPTVHKLDIETFTKIQLDLTRFISQTELFLLLFNHAFYWRTSKPITIFYSFFTLFKFYLNCSFSWQVYPTE